MSTQTEEQEVTDSIRTTLTLRHEAENRFGHDTIFVTRLPGGDARACKGIDEATALVAELEADPATKAIWTNIQKFKPNSEGRKKTNVIAYRNIVIDIDRRVKKDKGGNKVNATDEERAVLLAQVEEINAYMKTTAMGCCHTLADSGNGYHMNWRIENVAGLVTPEESKKDYAALLAELRKKFESPGVNMEIDQSLADETQVVTVWGTWNRKYPHTPDRPQRQSKIIYHSGTAIYPVDLMMTLDTLKKDTKDSGFVGEAAPASAASGGDYPICTEDWLENHGAEDLIEWGSPFIELIGTESRDDGEYYFYTPCLGHSSDEDGYEHDEKDAAKHSAIIEKADGGLAHSCWSQDLTIGGVIRKLEKLKGEKYPHQIFEREPFDPSLIANFAEIVNDDNEEPSAPEKAPKKTGLYKMPETCMFGWLGEMARKLDAPLGFAYPSSIAVYAGRNRIGTKSVRGNVYVNLIAPRHEGKSRTIKRADYVLMPTDGSRTYSTISGSDAGLVEMLGGKKDTKIDAAERFGMPRLIIEDEMQDAMNKMDIKGSSLPNKLNRLWYEDEVKHTVKKSDLTAYAYLTILGGLTINQDSDFAEMWGKNTVSGLHDRFIFAVAPKGWKWDDNWEEFEKVKPVLRKPAPVKITQEILEMKEAWVDQDRETRARLGEIALRIAVITTAADAGHYEVSMHGESFTDDYKPKTPIKDGYAYVTEECMRCALEFCDWQEAIRAKYKPSMADTPGGKLSELIVEDFKRLKDKDGNYAWASWTSRYRKNHWYRKDGRLMASQRDALVDAKILEAELEPVKDKDGNVTKYKRTGNYRYAGEDE